jgi:transcription antitermination factor NusG
MNASIIQPSIPDAIQPDAASVGAHVVSGAEGLEVASQARWYAVYTCANHEKCVAERFTSRNVEYFWPQYESVRRWKDRKVRLQLPLFPGYLFVRMALQQRMCVLQVPGVVRLVGFRGSPCPLPEEDVNRIREFLGRGWQAVPHPYLVVGTRARAVHGPLTGMEGIILRRKNRSRLVLSFDLIQRSIAIEMGEADLVAV